MFMIHCTFLYIINSFGRSGRDIIARWTLISIGGNDTRDMQAPQVIGNNAFCGRGSLLGGHFSNMTIIIT
jgi:hypothetical protein